MDDEGLGQQVVLVVAPLTPDCVPATLSRALARELPAYMVPRRIDVLAALPRSVNGKFDRVELRRAAQRAAVPAPDRKGVSPVAGSNRAAEAV